MTLLKYTETQMRSALTLLNMVGTKGIDNAKRIVMIEDILQHPVREEKENVNCSEKE